MNDVGRLLEEFVTQFTALVESETIARARTAVAAAFGQGSSGRPSKALSFTTTGRARKKPPVQLCPVPGCKNPAAPIFGMVCAEHKDVPKAKIKKYREARKARKAAKANSSAKPRTVTRRNSRPKKATEKAKRSARKRAAARPTAARKSAPRTAKKKTPPKTATAAPASPTPVAAAPAP